ncbi:sigma-70 family RNA polymerase sigma factor [Desulfitobacterium sp. LBE]|uniref:RNA polymerase sigma factor n=1 Tax=Desulfitobacterium sp. LBE TaxID=884086 RepID=UPI0011A3873F|nr:sigma-70 family RNA polymerase sigma factor [Desulfitobacterium sp. LBE]
MRKTSGGLALIDEDALLKKIRNGDEASLDKLVVFYYPDILRYCLWHTPNRPTAEDATQDTFLKAIRHLDAYVHRGKFRAYLYKIAANVCIDYSRKKIPEQLLGDWPEYDHQLERVESDANLVWLLRSLPDEQREVVLLRFAHELKVREIAEVIGVPMRTVQSRLRHALKRLEKDFTGREDS